MGNLLKEKYGTNPGIIARIFFSEQTLLKIHEVVALWGFPGSNSIKNPPNILREIAGSIPRGIPESIREAMALSTCGMIA